MAKTTRSNPLASRAARSLAAAAHLGPWELLGPLGEGQWARVFEARPRLAPQDRPADYAIKVAKTESGRREQAEQLITREATVARQVNHPNLIAVLAAQVDTEPYYLVMPLLRGVTLRAVLDRVGPLIPPQALWVARQVSQSLDALHQAGWMHADVKPSNILVSPEGHATLLDLGFALKLDSPESAAGGALRGTMLYTAPEMISAAVPVDGRSDVYSLGATLYEMIIGRPPFTHQDPGQLVLAHLQAPVPDPRRVIPSLHADVGRLLRDCLAKEPLRRPGAGELVERLVDLEIATLAERVADG